MKKTTPPKISYIRDLHKCVTRVTLTYEIQSEIHVCVFTLGDYKTIVMRDRHLFVRTRVRLVPVPTCGCARITLQQRVNHDSF